MRHWLSSAALLFSIFNQVHSECTSCANNQPTAVSPHKNIWLSLTEQELESVATLLARNLNASLYDYSEDAPNTGTWVNTIVDIELLNPNKTDVLPWLSGQREKQPDRYARATVCFGIVEEPYYQEYLVGPLPATNGTRIQTLTYPFNNASPGKTVIPSLNLPGQDSGAGLRHVAEDFDDITREIWNLSITDGNLDVRSQDPVSRDGKIIYSWLEFLGKPTSEFDTNTILPLGASFRLDVTDRDPLKWTVTGWFCLGMFYETTDEFRKAVFSESFEKPPANVDGSWAFLNKTGDSLPMDELPPPVTVSAGSNRFSVDVEENYVSWMNFAFFMSTTKSTGLSLFDLHYKGKRIIYEIGLQEALAHYAGSDPFQSHAAFLDSRGGLGYSLTSLVRGFDCPSYATYLNATFSMDGHAMTTSDAICLFEYDPGYPIHRHSSPEGFTSAAKNIMFTVRTIATVGNYDYLIDYEFFLDGSIEVHARASGYITAAYYANNEDYGFRIHDFLSGSIHDHVITFKADLDILGEKNSVQKVEFVPHTAEYAWAPGKSRNTFRADKTFIENEDEASINFAPNDAAQYSIVNKDAPNKYGEYPGFRIRRAAGTSHLTVKDSSSTGKAAHYAAHDFYITKQKDTEPRAADPYNGYNVQDPLVDFSKFLDGESLDGEDLVVWFNLGMHHLPHTGDLPNTLMTSAHSAIRLEPLNYLYGDPSMASSQQVRVFHETGEVVRFGADASNCSVDPATMNSVTPT